MKKIINFITAFALIFSNLIGLPNAIGTVFATDAGNVKVSVTYSDTTKTHTTPGEFTTFFINASVSGTNTNYADPYVDVEISKSQFEKPLTPSTAASLKKYELIEQTDKYIMRFTYFTLVGGTNVSIPFQLRAKNYAFAGNEEYPIKETFYEANGTKVVENTDKFQSSTISPTLSYYTSKDETFRVVGPEPAPATVPNDYTFKFTGDAYSAYTNSLGADKRDVLVTIQVPDNFVFNQANNAGWEYDAATKTLKKNIGKPNGSVPFSFTGQLENQTFNTVVPFVYSLSFINDDNSLEAINRTLTRNVTIVYQPNTDGKFGIAKVYKGRQARFFALDNFNNVLDWELSVNFDTDSRFLPIGARLGFNKITDIPREMNAIAFDGINFYTTQATTGVYDAENLAKLSRNRVVGTLPDGNTEVIATNIQLKTGNDNQFVPLPGKVYKQVDLIFDEEIIGTKISVTDMKILSVEYRTHLSNDKLNSLQTYYSNLNNITGTQFIYNDATISNTEGTSGRSNNYFNIRGAVAHVYSLNTTISNPQGGTLFFTNQTLNYHTTFNIEQRSANKRSLKDGKYIILAPSGLIFNGVTRVHDADDKEGNYKLSESHETVYNYKGTDRTAYIFDIIESDVNPAAQDSLLDDYKHVSATFTTTRGLPENTTLTIDTFISYSNNNEFNSELIVGKHADRLDIDEDGNTTEKIAESSGSFTFALPKELVISKFSKNDGEADGKYNGTTIVDGLSTANYRLDIFNNTDQPVNNVTVIDVLPYLNDKAIVADKDGVYAERGTQFTTTLKGKVTAPDKYTVYYSTDTPKSTLSENVNVNWQLENAITDFSKVTALKFVLNAGQVVEPKATDRIYFDVNTPSSSTIDEQKVSNNSVAYYYGTNIDGAVEGLKNVLAMSDYVVKGKAYYDTNDNATFDGTDFVIKNRKVTLYKVENGQEVEVEQTTTNDNGEYSFENIIEKRGDYRVKIEKATGDVDVTYLASVGQTVNNDLTTQGYAQATLTEIKQNASLNLALKSLYSNVVTHYESETGEQLADFVTTTGVQGTAYTTSQVIIDGYVFKEVSTTRGGNATGTYGTNDTHVYYIYKRANAGNVTVTYKDENGVELSTAVILDGTAKLNTPYTTTAVTINNYELVETPTNANGTYTSDAQTVAYVYRRKDAGNITVTYKDENGVELSTPTTLNGTDKLGLPYTTTPAEVENYEVVVTPTNANGTYTSDAQTVTYTYRRKDAGNITVTYKDENGVELSTPTTLNGTDKLGLTYTTTPAEVENYEVVVTPTNANGTYTSDAQTVAYVYRRKDAGNITVTYKDENGVEITTATVLDGTDKLGLNYTTTPAEVENYELVETPTNANGTYTSDAQTVAYVYRRKDAGNVTVKFVDENGVELSTPTTLNGTDKLGLPYTTTPAEVENYEVVETPTNANGTYTSDAQTVAYVYRRKDAGNITVTYKDENGVELSTPTTLNGTDKLGLPYTTTPAEVENYEVVETPTNANGTYTSDAQTVAYVYRRKDAGNITVTYKDENGVELSTPTTLNGTDKLGLPYTTTPAEVENYEVVVTPTNANGTYTSDAQTVAYTYRRKDAGNITVTYKDENGVELSTPTTLNGTDKLGLPYTTTPAEVENYEVVVTPTNANGTYTSDAQTVAYTYRRKDAGNITVTYKDENGVELSTPTTLNGTDKLGLTYTTTPAEVENYELVETPTNANGTYTSDAQTVTYTYRRKDAGNITVTYKDENGVEIITATVLDGTDKLGLSYTTSPAEVENYELVETPTNANGTYTSDAQTVTYTYRRKDAGNVTVKFVDENGVEITTPTVLDGTDKLGLAYTTTPAEVENYELVETPTNANGTYTSDAQTVAYVYRRKDAGNITVTYKDENGVEITTATVLDGTDKLGLNYTTSPAEVENYELVETPTNANGTYTSDAQTVAYVYRRKDAGNITVTYKDENGVEITTATVLDGTDKLGLNYTTSPAEVENYELVETPTNANGTYTSDAQTVTYTYRRKDAGNVTVKFVDENGNAIAVAKVLSGKGQMGLAYTTESISINGYQLIKIPTNSKGTFTSEEQSVIYVYRKIAKLPQTGSEQTPAIFGLLSLMMAIVVKVFKRD